MCSSRWVRAFDTVAVASRFARPCGLPSPPVGLAHVPVASPVDRERRPLAARESRRPSGLPMPLVLAPAVVKLS